MKSIIYVVLTFMAIHANSRAFAQIKNAETIEVKVEGLCNMCKNTIEKAGSSGNVSTTKWDRTSKLASITFDNKKTNKNDILKKIALVGYDNAAFLAPDEVYNALPGCCKYEREPKRNVMAKDAHQNHGSTHSPSTDHDQHTATSGNTFEDVLTSYFAIKNALVADNTQQATAKAKDLAQALQSVKMDEFSDDAHTLWMRTQKDITALTAKIVEAKNISQQRDTFALLSDILFPILQKQVLETRSTTNIVRCMPMEKEPIG